MMRGEFSVFKRWGRASLPVLVLVVAVLCAQGLAQRQSRHKKASLEYSRAAKFAEGRKLFLHEWKAGVPLAKGGDGLGPVFNDVSCVACHFQGGVGGGGTNDKNATMLTIVPPAAGLPTRGFLRLAASIHPGVVTPAGDFATSIVLHKHSSFSRYNRLRRRMVGLEFDASVPREQQQAVETWATRQPVRILPHASGSRLILSQRNTPPLFGMGLINQVANSTLTALATQQTQQGRVSGRVGRTNTGLGKFGWKAQTATLAEFVRGACANELGLQVPGADQARLPLKASYTPRGFDLDGQQLASLTYYVASLPAPSELEPLGSVAQDVVQKGRHNFDAVGCADCHVQSLGEGPDALKGIYSDLLLHDMGPNLADPVQKAQFLTSSGLPIITDPASLPPTSGYYGSAIAAIRAASRQKPVRVIPTVGDTEWRTPPLWGVAVSAPYLHDGRAETLREAIELHGGEAEASVKRFQELQQSDKQALLDFLNTLSAPQDTGTNATAQVRSKSSV